MPDTGDNKDYAKAKDALTKHFEPAKNPIYEIYNFRQAKQGADETIDQFHTRLRTLAQHCDSHNTDFEIKMQLVCNGTSSRLRRKALRDPSYKLEDMLIDGRKTEVSSAQASEMEETFQALEIKDVSTRNSCYKCGFSFPHKGKPCPARHAICSNCGVKGHFAKVCRKPKSAPQKKHHRWTPSQAQTPRKSYDKKKSRKSHNARQIIYSPAMNLVHQMMNMPMPWIRKEHIPHTKLSYG